jgi:hypothetical protein
LNFYSLKNHEKFDLLFLLSHFPKNLFCGLKQCFCSLPGSGLLRRGWGGWGGFVPPDPLPRLRLGKTWPWPNPGGLCRLGCYAQPGQSPGREGCFALA